MIARRPFWLYYLLVLINGTNISTIIIVAIVSFDVTLRTLELKQFEHLQLLFPGSGPIDMVARS